MKKIAKATGKIVYCFDLPAGWTCPAANLCLSKSNKTSGKITDGKHSKFRCYAASLEAAFPATRRLRWHNFDLLKQCSDSHSMEKLLSQSLPPDAQIVRIHSSGDFFNLDYFQAWKTICKKNTHVIFYGYTKRADLFGNQPTPFNMRFVQSIGGKYDSIQTQLPKSYVVDTPNQPFPVFDVDEKSELHILNGGGDFGLLIHGVQPAGWKGLDKGIAK